MLGSRGCISAVASAAAAEVGVTEEHCGVGDLGLTLNNRDYCYRLYLNISKSKLH